MLLLTVMMMLLAPAGDGGNPQHGSPARAVVIAHRGASALRPEHTLAAYALAIDDGADFVEPDLVSTKDGVLVARHENEIGATTDVSKHPEFLVRKTRKDIDGGSIEGWFTEDFTLAELKTLRARERLPKLRGTHYDGDFEIPTLVEIIDLVAAKSARAGRPIGLIPEIKHSGYFRQHGLPIEDRLLEDLAAHAYTRQAPIIIQSFEATSLRYLRSRLGRDRRNISLLQLLGAPKGRPADQRMSANGSTYADMMTPEGLRQIAGYAQSIGPALHTVIPWDNHRRLGQPTPLVRDAHAAGLKVFPYTLRPENRFRAAQFRQGASPDVENEVGSIAEIRAYLDAGIDGFFIDDPALGRKAVDGWQRKER